MDLESLSIPQLAQRLLEARKEEADFIYAQRHLQEAVMRANTKALAQTEYLRDLCKTKSQLIDLIGRMNDA